MSILIAKFKELKVGDKFTLKGEQYIKVNEFIMRQPSCCNFTRNTPVNAKKRDGQYVYFGAEEEIIVQI